MRFPTSKGMRGPEAGHGQPDTLSNLAERPSSRHITSLDGYRGLAFLLVFMRHFTLTRHVHNPIIVAVARVGEGGWAGVDLFFVLSGFLITGILFDTRSDPHFFRNFIARRALRIFPLYYTVLFVMLALTPLRHLQWHPGHVAYFFYLGNVAAAINPSLENVMPDFSMMHFWSLSVEEQFYCLWPLAILVAATPVRIIRLCLGLSLLALIIRIAIILSINEGTAFEWCSAQLPTRMDGLLYGAIAAILVRQFPLQRLLRPARLLFAAAAILLTAVIVRVGPNFANRLTTLAGYPLLAIFFASLLVLAMQPGSLAARVGELGFLRVLGRYSYGLYVYHLVASWAVAPLLVWLQQTTHSMLIGGILYTLAVFTGSFLVAVASYELYERHFLRLKRFFPYGQSSHALAGGTVVSV